MPTDAAAPPPADPTPVTRAAPGVIARLSGVPAALKACLMICQSLRDGGLTIVLPDGRRLGFGEADAPLQAQIDVKNPRFAWRVLRYGDIGFAEGYMAGEWDTPDLTALLTLFSANIERTARLLRGNPIARISHWLSHIGRENTRAGARRNILAHYDLGNRFYEAWLDPTMTYSSALFDTPGASLSDAQLAKYRAICKRIDLRPGEHVLEIGCGWGGFAEVAAGEFGARVTGLTLSDAQHDFAAARMQRQGLSSQVEIRLQDYRDVQGPFDKIASIEMFEAVGEKYWPAYFGKIAEVLKPGGKAGLQIITIRDDLFESYSTRVDFIQRYVFPGGMLPSVQRLREETGRAHLGWGEARGFGLDYAATLNAWGARFRGAWDEIRTLGFDERFKRLWQFYLSYCEAGFRTGRTDVVQLDLVRG